MTKSEYKKMQDKALEQLKSGKSLTGKDGAFAPLLKQFLESAMETEMDEFLDDDERARRNKRNGRGSKTVKSSAGNVEISPPYDRHSDFEPEIVKNANASLPRALPKRY
jgi:putative transposase